MLVCVWGVGALGQRVCMRLSSAARVGLKKLAVGVGGEDMVCDEYVCRIFFEGRSG